MADKKSNKSAIELLMFAISALGYFFNFNGIFQD